jgi:hypothetical protein
MDVLMMANGKRQKRQNYKLQPRTENQQKRWKDPTFAPFKDPNSLKAKYNSKLFDKTF